MMLLIVSGKAAGIVNIHYIFVVFKKSLFMLFMACMCYKICTNHLLQLITITSSSVASVASLTTQRSKPHIIIQNKHTGFIILVPQRGILAWDISSSLSSTSLSLIREDTMKLDQKMELKRYFQGSQKSRFIHCLLNLPGPLK